MATQSKKLVDKLKKEPIERQNATLVHLATHSALAEGRLKEALEIIAETTAETMNVDRVNIWRFLADSRELFCLEDFERLSGKHIAGRILAVEGYPCFFSTLKAERVVDARDVLVDPRTTELTEECWMPRGIGASLNAPICLHGEMIGLVSYDHFGSQRDWSPDEVSFADQVANLIAQVFLSADLRRRAQEMAAITRVSHEITSLSDLQQVYESIARHASELSQSDASGVFNIRSDGHLYVEVGYGVQNDFIEAINAQGVPLGHGAIGRAAAEHCPIQVSDTVTEPNYSYTQLAKMEHVRSILAVPMLRGENVIGGIVLWHRQPRHFTSQEVAFIQALAQECVNAVENARLLEAEARRRREAETLSMVVQALSSTLDLQHVFELILSELRRVVPYDSASVQQLIGNQLEIIGGHGFPNLGELLGVRFVLTANDNPNREVVRMRAPLILDDAPTAYEEFHREPHAQANIHSWLGVPLLFGDRLIGMIALDKQEPGFYSQEHARLALAFAAQAAIAIENARLFESERAQLCLAQTLQEVGALLTTRMSLDEVFEHIFDLLARVVEYDSVSMQMLDQNGSLDLVAGRGFPNLELARQVVRSVAYKTLERNWNQRKVIVIPDTYADPDWIKGQEGIEYIRSWIGAALLVKGVMIGILNVDSSTVNAYNEAMGETVAAFANQAAIAIENARMFTELKQAEEALRKLNEELEQRVEARTTELRETNRSLQESLETLQRTQSQLVQSEKMAALGSLVAGVSHEISTPVGIGVTAASHLDQKSREIERRYREGEMTRSDLERYLKTACQSSEMILGNLRRAADHIQSFKQVAVDQASGDKRRFKLKEYLDEILLSLHPKLKRTTHTITVNCSDGLEIESYPGAFSQIITNFVLNSLNHGFEDKEHGHITLDIIYQNDALQLRYSDNGKGIPHEECLRIFEPFYTTKRGQGGSGLGLHIVYNLVTQRLNGHITCESMPGIGTTFLIQVPLEPRQF